MQNGLKINNLFYRNVCNACRRILKNNNKREIL